MQTFVNNNNNNNNNDNNIGGLGSIGGSVTIDNNTVQKTNTNIFVFYLLFIFCHTTDNNTKIIIKEQGKKRE